jgi:hypothetical protein
MIPFNGAVPARGDYFYGRDKELRAILQQAWTWVCGPRRMGKSSLLLRAQDVEGQSGKTVPLYFDLAPIQNRPSSAELFSQFFRRHHKGATNLAQFGIERQHFDGIEPAESFRLLVEKIAASGRKTMFLWDEAEHLVTLEQREPGFLDSLRAQLQDLTGFRFVIAGSQRLSAIFGLPNQADLFLSNFTWLPVAGLGEPEARAVLRGEHTGGWESPLPDEIVRRAIAWTGGYSIFVQNLGSALWNACEAHGDRVDDATYNQCVDEVVKNPVLRDIMRDDYARLTRTQRTILDRLCDARAGVPAADLRAVVADPAIEDALGFLTSYGYAAPSEPVRLRYELYRRFRPSVAPSEAPDPELVNRIAVPTVMFSYSPGDEPFAEQLRTQLLAMARGSGVEIWDPKQIALGADAKLEVSRAIARASVIVLLVSADFLASPAIAGTELPMIARAAESGLCRLATVYVRAVGDGLDALQLPRDKANLVSGPIPVQELPEPQRARVIAESAKAILAAAAGWAKWKRASDGD